MLYFTTDGGHNWGYQLPKLKIDFERYENVDFVNSKIGWAYKNIRGGIYTRTSGNDSTIYLNVNNISTEIPLAFKLYQNYPNPFNPLTKIRYDILKRTEIKLKVFDINGREIIELIDEEQSAGTYEAEFDATGISSGIYFAVLNADNFKDVIRMILIK